MTCLSYYCSLQWMFDLQILQVHFDNCSLYPYLLCSEIIKERNYFFNEHDLLQCIQQLTCKSCEVTQTLNTLGHDHKKGWML